MPAAGTPGEFKVSLVYKAIFRTTRAVTQRNPASAKKKEGRKKLKMPS